MYVSNNIIAASRSSVLTNGCRIASIETCVTSHQTKSRPVTSTQLLSHRASNPSREPKRAFVTVTAASGTCILCDHLRWTVYCSASTTIQPHFNIFRNKHVLPAASSRFHSPGTNTINVETYNYTNNFLNNNAILSSREMLPSTVSYKRNFIPTSAANLLALITASTRSCATIAFPTPMLLSEISGRLTGDFINNGIQYNENGWSIGELICAIALASAVTAGSVLLGPTDTHNGNGCSFGSNDGHGSPGGGDCKNGGNGGGNNKNDGKILGTQMRENDSTNEVTVRTSNSPPSYEVSVRALRGGRLSMEDEFVIAGGGRLSAVFDGHGGGGVSQYLRDRLHVVISEQLNQQERTQQMSRCFRGDLKSFMFRKGIHDKRNNQQGSGANCQNRGLSMDNRSTNQTNTMMYNPSIVSELTIADVANALRDSFDQIDKEILAHDEYEYQGSTAVAVLLHEGADGARTLVSANIGDSRGILSRNGNAIDLTRDHKPNDDNERARILAMGEKIEWDHYCKVHRVRNLSLSRAVGDRFAKPAVSGEVEIQQFPVYEDKDEFILLASDGLWDVMTSQEVVSYVHKRLNAAPKDGADIKTEEDMEKLRYLRRKNMSRFIANEALRRGSGDNISVVIVWLKNIEK